MVVDHAEAGRRVVHSAAGSKGGVPGGTERGGVVPRRGRGNGFGARGRAWRARDPGCDEAERLPDAVDRGERLGTPQREIGVRVLARADADRRHAGRDGPRDVLLGAVADVHRVRGLRTEHL